MLNFKNSATQSNLAAAFFCLCLLTIGTFCRPLFPVDETRYLTVAWEMFSAKEWILLHLNYETYDQKPPLLFWCINLLWKIFGVSQEAAMALPFIFSFFFLVLTQRLARKMVPEDDNFPLLATFILAGSLPFIVYANMIMFDLMLGVVSLFGITAIWDLARTGKSKNLFFFALAIGLGALAKGPVILLHTLFPVVLASLWIRKDALTPPRAKWITGFIAAILGGTIIGLCWAIPAAIKGGPEFANKIFWGQTAGRVTNAFDHAHPFWWYLPFLPALLAPWIFSPVFWRGVKALKDFENRSLLKFLTLWVVPVFFCFCAISGKQIHYLIPLLPGVTIFMALAFRQAQDSFRTRDAILPFVVTGILILGPAILKLVTTFKPPKTPFMADVVAHIDYAIPLAIFLLSAILTFTFGRKNLRRHVIAIAVSSLLAMASFQIEARNGFFKNYDLTPIADIVQKNPHAPLAFARNYHGEWGFLARSERPVKQLEPEYLSDWFRKNPDGMAFIRTSRVNELKPYDVIFQMPYKTDNTYAVVVKRGRAARFVK